MRLDADDFRSKRIWMTCPTPRGVCWFLSALLLVLSACASSTGRRPGGDSSIGVGDSAVTDTGSRDSGRPDARPTDSGGGDGGGGCAPGEMECGTLCSDLSTDPDNCGDCGVACAIGQACAAGMCVVDCPAGQIECGGGCVDPASDPMYCGATGPGCTGGEACPSGEACMAGVCSIVCAAGLTDCGGACVDTATDVAHCGMCMSACAAGETCVAGTCTAPMDAMVTFPATGDTRVAAGGGPYYYWRLGDYVQGVRTTTLPSARSVNFNLQLTSNGLTCDTQDVSLSINGTVVGSFSIAGGPMSISQSYTFAPITGPTYTLRLATTRQVGSGCGAASYADDVTVFTLGG